MSPVDLIPDGEQIVIVYLDDHPDISALGARVAGKTPSSQAAPWVRLTQIDATRIGPIDYLTEFYFQLDCYAGAQAQQEHRAQAEASLLARTVRGALAVMHQTTHDGAVVSGIPDVSSGPRLPDGEGFEPARERVILTATIHMRPA